MNYKAIGKHVIVSPIPQKKINNLNVSSKHDAPSECGEVMSVGVDAPIVEELGRKMQQGDRVVYPSRYGVKLQIDGKRYHSLMHHEIIGVSEQS